jgi:RIO-like serine/threonine protein kinase
MSDVDALIKTVQDLRYKKYPDLPEDLVNEILKIEIECTDDRVEALKRIRLVVENYLNKGATGKCSP